MHVLVTVASKHGATAEIGAAIAEMEVADSLPSIGGAEHAADSFVTLRISPPSPPREFPAFERMRILTRGVTDCRNSSGPW